MTDQHPRPWRVGHFDVECEDGYGGQYSQPHPIIIDANNKEVCPVKDEATALCIVVCVNALQHLSTEMIEDGVLNQFYSIQQLMLTATPSDVLLATGKAWRIKEKFYEYSDDDQESVNTHIDYDITNWNKDSIPDSKCEIADWDEETER